MSFVSLGCVSWKTSQFVGTSRRCERHGSRRERLSSQVIIVGCSVGTKTEAAGDSEGEKSFFLPKVGELALHDKYGIGRFLGIQTSNGLDGEVEQDFVVMDYSDGDLLIPMTQVDRLSPVRDNMGSKRLDTLTAIHDFENSTYRKRSRAKKIGKEREKIRKRILDLHGMYASRNKLRRSPIKVVNTEAEARMSQSFPYEMTSGQEQALTEIMRDLSVKNQPMDRLLCGDVGFGKTEVGLRTALRIILSGRQVVLLCPTTILATQHFNNAKERMKCVSDLVKIGRLSRFVPKQEQLETIAKLRDGSINLVIGTHSILNPEIEFQNLGLLIVDEEHRFGVYQKEKIRERQLLVDVLSMSATPIPRTLHLAMHNIRDVSVISTPPKNRKPIITRIAPRGNGTARKAIGYELGRGGQVFYVVQHVAGIEGIASWLQSLFPERRILIAHGQMKDLEKRVYAFAEGRADILVCTTIIETGIDMPRVNTIIIDEPSNHGLAQLHQLRGRVGRGAVQGIAWLLFKGSQINEKLKTLEEFSDLGAGFQIAKKDLAMRGMGTVLGLEQSGKACGIEPADYARLLAEEISLAKQTEIEVLPPLPEVATTEIFLPVESLIPADYIKDDELRFETYFQLARSETTEELGRATARVARIWGSSMPLKMQQHIFLLEAKIYAKTLGISRIFVDKNHVVLEWDIAAKTVNFLRTFLQDKRDMDRFDAHEDAGQVVLRGLGVCEGDVQIAKLRVWLKIFARCVEDMRKAEESSII